MELQTSASQIYSAEKTMEVTTPVNVSAEQTFQNCNMLPSSPDSDSYSSGKTFQNCNIMLGTSIPAENSFQTCSIGQGKPIGRSIGMIPCTKTFCHAIPPRKSNDWIPFNGTYFKFSSRLDSFKNWPYSFKLGPIDMAKAGFYYLNQQDIVTCFHCGVTLSNWVSVINIKEEHRKHSPTCNYLKMVYDSDFLDLTCFGINTSYTTGLSPWGLPDMLWENEWTPFNTAKVNYRKRLNTFSTWPIQMKQLPHEMVDSGFYYTGEGDRVTCFYCGVTVLNWEIIDEAFSEHKKHSADCKFINMISTI